MKFIDRSFRGNWVAELEALTAEEFESGTQLVGIILHPSLEFEFLKSASEKLFNSLVGWLISSSPQFDGSVGVNWFGKYLEVVTSKSLNENNYIAIFE